MSFPWHEKSPHMESIWGEGQASSIVKPQLSTLYLLLKGLLPFHVVARSTSQHTQTRERLYTDIEYAEVLSKNWVLVSKKWGIKLGISIYNFIFILCQEKFNKICKNHSPKKIHRFYTSVWKVWCLIRVSNVWHVSSVIYKIWRRDSWCHFKIAAFLVKRPDDGGASKNDWNEEFSLKKTSLLL